MPSSAAYAPPQPAGSEAMAGAETGRPGRLALRPPSDRIAGWVGPLLVTALAGYLRFYRLSVPEAHVFDEVYYAKDAYSLLQHGVEVDKGTAAFVAHPPLGKWAIAAGQGIFGNTSLGWRFSAAVAGTLAVLLVARIGRRLFGSTLLGCLAGLLLALDGLAFVQSRTAMLDIFLMLWVLAAFGCLLVDRDQFRARLAAAPPDGRAVGIRWWRLAVGGFLGAACATKWSGLYYVAAFAALALVWDVGARRRAGGRGGAMPGALLRILPGIAARIAASLGGVAALVYTASWTGWFLGDERTAWGHDTHVRAGQNVVEHGVAVLRGWFGYHSAVWHFHDTLTSRHTYESHPIGWLLLARPVSYFYEGPKYREAGCPSPANCSREILAIGTPAIWWPAIAALIAVAWFWVSRRDWRAAAILVGVAAGIAPWLYYDLKERTQFFFYALPAVPFLVLALTMCAGVVLGPRSADRPRRIAGAALVGAYVVAVVASFFYFYPVLAAELLSYPAWRSRMWISSWI